MTKRTNGGGADDGGDGNDGNDKTPGAGKPDYEVGYKKPPLGTRWTSVHQPKQRTPRKGTPNFRDKLMAFMMAKVWVTLKDGSRIKMPRYEAIFHKVYEQNTGKSANAGGLRLVELMLRELTVPEPEEIEAVTADDEAILADFIRRETANRGGDKTEPPEVDDACKDDGAGDGDA
ncbi:MAG: hypothetical protein AB7G25_03415 [Sphingomonadaceae bacterium]